jgi:hypothetical protein
LVVAEIGFVVVGVAVWWLIWYDLVVSCVGKMNSGYNFGAKLI